MKKGLLIILVLTGCNLRQVTIEVDELGVTDTGDKVLSPGTHMVNEPVTIYDIKELSITENVDILSKDKQSVSGEFYFRCFPDKVNLNRLHKTYGPKYKDILIIPETRASIRSIFSKLNGDSLIIIDKVDIESMIKSDLSKTLADRDIILSYFEIKTLILPNDKDQKTRDYILSNVKSSYR